LVEWIVTANYYSFTNNFAIQSFIYYKVHCNGSEVIRKMPTAIWVLLFVIIPTTLFLTVILPLIRRREEN